MPLNNQGKEITMKRNGFSALIVSTLLLVLVSGTSYGQNLSSLLDAIQKVEAKLTRLIGEESTARKNADELIRSASPKEKPQTVAMVTTDTTLKADIEMLRKNIDTLEASQSDISGTTEKIQEELKKIQNREGEGDNDKEIKLLAESLMNLINELKTVLDNQVGEPEKESVEIGGVVTVDAGIDPKDVKGSSAEIGEVSLSANVYLTPDITASITLLSEGNLEEIAIDEALVEWSPEGKCYNLVFGQHTLNHGLLTTHLISDPVILDNVETVLPGLSGQFEKGHVTMGIGLGYFHEDAVVEDSFYLAGTAIVREEITREGASDLLTGVLNIDAAFLEESNARLSVLFKGDAVDVALGTGIVMGGVSLDMEGFVEAAGEEGEQPAGYYTGLAYTFNDAIETALRYDGLSPDLFSEIDHRIGVGVTFGLIYDIFLAAEYGYSIMASGEKSSEVALQLGIESAMQLPGFQRKTLTRD